MNANGGDSAAGIRGGGGSAWDVWELGNWPSSSHVISSTSYAPPPSFNHHLRGHHHHHLPPTIAGSSSWVPNFHHQQRHHLTCLKLGKRHLLFSEETGPAAPKRPAPEAPRCQVEGCGKVLSEEKEYHKRHKVCEPHSKAAKVVVLGLDQRFCQQCSRFHAIAEFDEAKRSCRRRLAGHNERRRKGNNAAESVVRTPAALERALSRGMIASYVSSSPSPACALSLLSSNPSPSPSPSPWISDFSSRSSAALDELIAENRAALLARQLLFSDPKECQQQQQQQQAVTVPGGCGRLPEIGRSHLTLDLMRMPGDFEVSGRNKKSKGEEEECSEMWYI